MPQLPSYYGQMGIGQPTVLLAAANIPQKSYHTGDKIGPFEIVSFDHDKITFAREFEDRIHVRRLTEEMHRNDRLRLRRDGGFERGRVHRIGVLVHIDKHRPRS